MCDSNRIFTTKPGLVLRSARPEGEDFLFRIFVASKAADFDGMPLPQAQKDLLLKQQHVSQIYNWQAVCPTMEQWIIESDGEPVSRLIFSILPDQIVLNDLAMLPGKIAVSGGKTVIRDVIFAEATRSGQDRACFGGVAQPRAQALRPPGCDRTAAVGKFADDIAGMASTGASLGGAPTGQRHVVSCGSLDIPASDRPTGSAPYAPAGTFARSRS